MKKEIIVLILICFFLVPFLTTASAEEAEEIGCLNDNNPPEIEWWSYQSSAVKGVEYRNAFTADFMDCDHDDCRIVVQIKDTQGNIIDTVHSNWDCYYGSCHITYTYTQEIGTTLNIELWVEDAQGAESGHETGTVEIVRGKSKTKFASMDLLERFFNRSPLLKQLFLNSGFFDKLLSQ